MQVQSLKNYWVRNGKMDGNICELCATTGGTLLWESPTCRVVRIDDPNYPGFCRVIWTAHAREMTDLDPGERLALMNVVFAVEKVVRTLFVPDKINLASFGNMTPHLHWHVIPRWRNDRHFPEPIWGLVQRDTLQERAIVDDETLRQALRKQLYPDELQG
jgi:diadenosine tetraphosphate (Ap4A) HIT family hydrolase